MNDIKDIIKKELRNYHKNYLIENIQPLNKIDNENDFYINYIKTTIKLLNEGYDINEIELITEQTIGQRIGQGAKALFPEKPDVMGGIFSGAWSLIKEQIIRWLINSFGISGGLANAIASVLGDIDPRKALRMFKSREHCIAEAPMIADAILEAIVGYLLQGSKPVTWKTDKGTITMKNMIGELIKQSNLGELIAQKLTTIIWKQ